MCDLVEFLQRLLKNSGESADAHSMLMRSECRVPNTDLAGGNPLLNFNFITLEKYQNNSRRRYEIQVRYLFINRSKVKLLFKSYEY